MTYRDHLFALAAQWKFGAGAGHVLALLPEGRRLTLAPVEPDPLQRLGKLARKESARVQAWGRKRFGLAWDRLDPRVRSRLVKQHGRNH